MPGPAASRGDVLRVLAATVVHHPEDARILHRQIRALVDRGHHVTYLAPFTATGTTPRPWVDPVDVPRATGRRRLHALRAARRQLARRGPDHDILLLHDPELVMAVAGLHLPPTVWDIHEDTAASMALKPWLPRPFRPAATHVARKLERHAERRLHLLLAEDAYAGRFTGRHPVVPNATTAPDDVPPPGDRRVVYVGHLSRARGAFELVEVARALRDELEVVVVGAADAETRPMLQRAHQDAVLRWHGYLPNDQALALVEGALAGLSLLHDEENYRGSRPTKIIEYMARGVPVITTPNPVAQALVTRHDCGVVVPFGTPADVVKALRRLRDDAFSRRRLGANGHGAARTLYHWPVIADGFVASLQQWAHGARGRRPSDGSAPSATG